MKNTLIALAVASTLVGCGRIESGYVGIRTDFNKTVQSTPMQPGFYTAFFSHVDEYVTKEIEVKFDQLTPKGKDNLVLADFDVSIWYLVKPEAIVPLRLKYSSMSAEEHGQVYPQYHLVERTARGAIFDVVSRFDSLTMHTKRSELELAIKEQVQKEMDSTDKGQFVVTRTIVRQIQTDPALDKSIQMAVQVQKEIEAKRQQVDLAKMEANRVIAEAQGTAQRNKLLTESITPQLIEYKKALAMEECGSRVGCTMIVGLDKSSPILNLGK